jgi:hypothetical protein
MSENNNNPPLSEIQQKAIKFLEKKWPKEKQICEVCGGGNWSIQEHSVTPIILKNGGFQLGGNAYPQVMVVCGNCSNTKYFNTVIMDAIEKEQNGGGKDAK